MTSDRQIPVRPADSEESLADTSKKDSQATPYQRLLNVSVYVKQLVPDVWLLAPQHRRGGTVVTQEPLTSGWA